MPAADDDGLPAGKSVPEHTAEESTKPATSKGFEFIFEDTIDNPNDNGDFDGPELPSHGPQSQSLEQDLVAAAALPPPGHHEDLDNVPMAGVSSDVDEDLIFPSSPPFAPLPPTPQPAKTTRDQHERAPKDHSVLSVDEEAKRVRALEDIAKIKLRALSEREHGLSQSKAELDQREDNLGKFRGRLNRREDRLDEREDALEVRENRLKRREEEFARERVTQEAALSNQRAETPDQLADIIRAMHPVQREQLLHQFRQRVPYQPVASGQVPGPGSLFSSTASPETTRTPSQAYIPPHRRGPGPSPHGELPPPKRSQPPSKKRAGGELVPEQSKEMAAGFTRRYDPIAVIGHGYFRGRLGYFVERPSMGQGEHEFMERWKALRENERAVNTYEEARKRLNEER